jgi:hypothetical protein
MFALLNTERAIETIAVFILTFLITLSLGRLLKRRAGVPLGVFFQLFALTLSCYTAAWVYGVDLHWRHHLGAVLILLSTTIVIAFINRYIWNAYFERRGIPVPKLLRDPRRDDHLSSFYARPQRGLSRRDAPRDCSRAGAFSPSFWLRRPEPPQQRDRRLSLQTNGPTRSAIGSKSATPWQRMETGLGATRLRTNDAITLHIPKTRWSQTT